MSDVARMIAQVREVGALYAEKSKTPRTADPEHEAFFNAAYLQGFRDAVGCFEKLNSLPSCARCGQPCARTVKSPDSSHVWHVHQIADGELRCLEGS